MKRWPPRSRHPPIARAGAAVSRRRTGRTLAAAEVELAAGDPIHAQALLDAMGPWPDDQFLRARSRRLEAGIRFVQGRPAETPTMLLEAARAFESIDARPARDTLMGAVEAAPWARQFVAGEGLVGVARAALAAPSIADAKATVSDLLLDGFATRLAVGYTAAAPLLRRAVAALRSDELGADEQLSCMALGCVAAAELVDFEAQCDLASRWVRAARQQGALPVAWMPQPLNMRKRCSSSAWQLRGGAALCDGRV